MILSTLLAFTNLLKGLILFAIGGEIELNHFKAMGRKLLFMAMSDEWVQLQRLEKKAAGNLPAHVIREIELKTGRTNPLPTSA